MPETTLALLFGINAVIMSLAALYIGASDIREKSRAERRQVIDFELKTLKKMVINPTSISNRKKLEILYSGFGN